MTTRLTHQPTSKIIPETKANTKHFNAEEEGKGGDEAQECWSQLGQGEPQLGASGVREAKATRTITDMF